MNAIVIIELGIAHVLIEGAAEAFRVPSANLPGHLRWAICHDGIYEGPIPISMYMEML